ncbi:MAG: radical SAM protein [Elusimicrobiota bacterium]
MRKALLKVGYSCNSNCVFCHSLPLRRYPDLSTEELERRIESARRAGADAIIFSGGEPTLRRDFVSLVRFSRSRGLKTGLITNGRRFVYPSFGEELSALGLVFAYVSFHSARAATHDSTTRTRSFPQTLAALRNLSKLKLELVVNTIVTSRNVSDLPAVVDLLAPLTPAKIKFSIVEPKGAALDDQDVCPPISAAAAAINSAVRYGRSRYPDLKFGCEGLTPCLLEDFDALNDDLLTNGFVSIQESFEKDPFIPDHANRGKPAACCDCSRFEDCPGVFSEYLASGASAPLRPVIRPRSNSFVFRRTGRPLPLPSGAGDCPGRDAGARRIFIAGGGRMSAYFTPTVDFSDAAIDRVRGLGQIYSSKYGRSKGIDYGRDLIKNRVSSICSTCEKGNSCSRIYEPTTERAFASLESSLEELVRRIRGDVLDVGCGSVRFGDIIEDRVRAGKMTYVGIDPELSTASVRRGMVLRRCDLENFETRDASFDHILLLRSYNHLRLPSVLFPKLRRMLKPRGRLTVVDGGAFGLVLTREPEEAALGAFQHFRNHTSGQARELLESFGFRAFREIPITAEGGSEWLLELGKK